MAAPVGPRKANRYSLDFKLQVVRFANHPEIQTQDVAQALDIHPFMLSIVALADTRRPGEN